MAKPPIPDIASLGCESVSFSPAALPPGSAALGWRQLAERRPTSWRAALRVLLAGGEIERG
jgi:hypothetical protein